MESDSTTARALLSEAGHVARSVRSVDTIRRNVYRIQAVVVAACVAPFDAFRGSVAAALCFAIIAAGLVLTVRELRRSKVINREAMVSYTVVIAVWSVLWVGLMTVVGPWLSDRLAIGWTVTGLIGTIPFLVGLAWERRK